jgi:hypothetical protein
LKNQEEFKSMETQAKVEPFTEADFPGVDFTSIDSVRNAAMRLTGAGHGAKLQFLRGRMMRLYPHHVEDTPERQDAQVEATLKRFLKRPGLPLEKPR